jgi:hypothetical protein
LASCWAALLPGTSLATLGCLAPPPPSLYD